MTSEECPRTPREWMVWACEKSEIRESEEYDQFTAFAVTKAISCAMAQARQSAIEECIIELER